MGRTLRQGEIFAGFRVQRRLGAGGMGAVYAVDHPRLPRQVALKLLTADATDQGAAARFEREAETIARLDHPNIVGVLDRGIEDGHPWISMQLIDGVDADSLLRSDGPLPLGRVVHIGTQIAEALDAAHRRGVVHRDVKPANIMLARAEHGQSERALITDFGIARLEQAADVGGASPGEDSTAPVDITGSLDGVRATAAYASPEQLAGDPTDGRSDQYSLACTVFALLTGHGPYPGPARTAIMGHLNAPIPSADVERPDIPKAAAVALQRAMSKRAADRYDNCAQLMQHFRTSLTAPAAPAATKRNRMLLPAVGVAALLGVGGVGLWQVLGADADQKRMVIGTTTATRTTVSTSTKPTEDDLWRKGAPVLAMWPNLFPQSPSAEGYQNMLCSPNDEEKSFRKVQSSYRFICAVRQQGPSKPVIDVDLVVYKPGDGQRAQDAMVDGVPPLPVVAHGTKLRTYHLNDPVAGSWILVRYTAADKQDIHIQVGTKDGSLSYSELYDWIAAAPF